MDKNFYFIFTFIFSLVNDVKVSIAGNRYEINVGIKKNESVIEINGNCKYFNCNLSNKCSSNSFLSSSIIDGELVNNIIELKLC